MGQEEEPKEILVVDDDESIRQFLKGALTSSQRVVYTASNLQEAKAALNGHSIDLLLLDLYLPDGNGIKLLTETKEKPPTIVMTAFGGWETHVKAYNLGAFYYLDKPFKLSQLRILIDQALRGRTTPESRC